MWHYSILFSRIYMFILFFNQCFRSVSSRLIWLCKRCNEMWSEFYNGFLENQPKKWWPSGVPLLLHNMSWVIPSIQLSLQEPKSQQYSTFSLNHHPTAQRRWMEAESLCCRGFVRHSAAGGLLWVKHQGWTSNTSHTIRSKHTQLSNFRHF